MKKTFIGSFPTHDRLASKIQHLKSDGVKEHDMYIVMKDEMAVEQLKTHATKDGIDSPFNLFNRFLGFLVGENNVRRMLRDSGFTNIEAKQYFDAIQEGALLLYIKGELDKVRSSESQEHDTGYPNYQPIPLDEVEADYDN
ncbi:general stress protein [Sporosarcina oncorhynchi]|uniref:General stress protein n=1 Tax=Sporosarcina oncorhynchi TaxID=3056444 RepID=A0ABZ0L9L3_9BACL|nr:general stress protein [Sporosarcina sp. T2O-4]WOV88226.1 general stress protein [Sporosarcina sp. T2O-4]